MKRLHSFYSFWYFLVLTGVVSGCSNSVISAADFISISRISKTTAAHSTTRQFQRKVFYVNNQYIVFYTNGKDDRYVTSKDGVLWSKSIKMDRGIGSSSSTDVIFRDNNFYYFSSLDDDPSPDKRKMDQYVQKGVLDGQRIDWLPIQKIFSAENSVENFFYCSASLSPDGYFWLVSRHGIPERGFQDAIVARTAKPFDISEWVGLGKGLKNTDSKGLGTQIIGLEDGKAYLVSKATDKKTFFANFYDGNKWLDKDLIISKGSDVWGDDKRMSMVFEPAHGLKKSRIHLVYIDDNDHLRYRFITSPYEESDWNPKLDLEGIPVLKEKNGSETEVFTCVLAIDTTQNPAILYLLYGEIRFQGGDPREIMGSLKLIRHTNDRWNNRSLVMSEVGTNDNWYPSLIQNVDNKICVLYLKKKKRPYVIMFSSADRSKIDEYFDKRCSEE